MERSDKQRLMQKRNVKGVGVGEKVTDGECTGEECVTVLVCKKVSEEKLKTRDVVPKRFCGRKTDVVEVGEVKAGNREPVSPEQVDDVGRVERQRPFPMGVSVGHKGVTAGTAGFVAWRPCTYSFGSDVEVGYSEPVLVSNNHVLADVNNGVEGDAVLQPGSMDDGFVERDKIGELGGFVPLSKNEENGVDAAWCHLDGDVATRFIEGVGVAEDVVDVEVGERVAKSGRTTGYTEGEVVAKDVRITVGYSDGSRVFDGQVVTSDMSRGGDSGSLGVSLERDGGFGLLFAGSDKASVFNPLRLVLDELGLEVRPG